MNPDAKTISVKTANGAEMVFKYTDTTVVSGAEKSVAGLATDERRPGDDHLQGGRHHNVATKIEVRNKS